MGKDGYQLIKEIASQTSDTALDTAGAAALGPLWSFIKPAIVLPIKRLLGPSPTDEAIDEYMRAWTAEQARIAERRELIRELLDETTRDGEGRTIRDAKIALLTEGDGRSRRMRMRIQGYAVIDLATSFARFYDDPHVHANMVAQRFAVLGLSPLFIESVRGVLHRLLENQPGAEEMLAAIALDVRDALSCQMHPFMRLLFEVSLRAGYDDAEEVIEIGRDLARQMEVADLLVHALASLRQVVQGAPADVRIRALRSFCEGAVEFF